MDVVEKNAVFFFLSLCEQLSVWNAMLTHSDDFSFFFFSHKGLLSRLSRVPGRTLQPQVDHEALMLFLSHQKSRDVNCTWLCVYQQIENDTLGADIVHTLWLGQKNKSNSLEKSLPRTHGAVPFHWWGQVSFLSSNKENCTRVRETNNSLPELFATKHILRLWRKAKSTLARRKSLCGKKTAITGQNDAPKVVEKSAFTGGDHSWKQNSSESLLCYAPDTGARDRAMDKTDDFHLKKRNFPVMWVTKQKQFEKQKPDCSLFEKKSNVPVPPIRKDPPKINLRQKEIFLSSQKMSKCHFQCLIAPKCYLIITCSMICKFPSFAKQTQDHLRKKLKQKILAMLWGSINLLRDPLVRKWKHWIWEVVEDFEENPHFRLSIHCVRLFLVVFKSSDILLLHCGQESFSSK